VNDFSRGALQRADWLVDRFADDCALLDSGAAVCADALLHGKPLAGADLAAHIRLLERVGRDLERFQLEFDVSPQLTDAV
jgi:hypothetical protein